MSSNGNSDWWRGGVIYQVYPRSFQDSDGDGMGDLAGITDRLDHIARLGVDAVWIAPFFTSPMADMGYDVSNYTDVDPIFGTLEDFDRLLARAHELGLKVIIDQVLSHTSDQHPWFLESRTGRDNPRADWYVWADPQPDGTPPNNWLSVFGGPAWEWDGVRKQYYLHNFLASQPDLNFHCEAVQDALLDTVRFWLDRGVDGFRLDTANFYFHDPELRSNPPIDAKVSAAGIGADAPDTNPYGMQNHVYSKSRPENIGFLERFRALLDEYEATASVGEIGDARAIQLTAEYTAGRRLHMAYTFDLLSDRFSADYIRNTVRRFEDAVTEGWVCYAFSNHDVMRHVSRWCGPERDLDQLAKFAATLLLTLRGSVCLYQGEELGLTEAELAYKDLQDPYGIRFWPAFKGRDGCRTPMVWRADAPHGGFTTGKPWLPVPEAHLPLAADRQEGDARSVLEHYRAMLALRAQTPALVDGDMAFLEMPGDVLGFTRAKDGEALLLVFNFEDAPVTVAPPKARLEPVTIPGSGATLGDQGIQIPPLHVFCGRLSQ